MLLSSLRFLLFLLLSLAPTAWAVIPRPCASNLTATPAICCPTPTGYRSPCGFPSRGRCHLAVSFKAPGQENYSKQDIRLEWPARVFQYVCRCADRYWGVACEGCQFGFEGSHCQHRVRHVRRDIKSYNRYDQRRFIRVLTAAHHTTSDFVKPQRLGTKGKTHFRRMSIYENAVFTHALAATLKKPPTKGSRKCHSLPDLNHGVHIFILWHRYFILWWERQLRVLAEKQFGMRNFTFPYWDYTGKNSCEICRGDYLCGVSHRRNGRLPAHCKISRWEVFCEADSPNCDICNGKKNRIGVHRKFKPVVLLPGQTQMPSQSEITLALRAPGFSLSSKCSNFAEYIESGCSCQKRENRMHNLIHNMFRGDMSTSDKSTNDPLFFLHHSQIDRLFQRWFLVAKPTPLEILRKDPKQKRVCRWCNLVGFLPTVNAVDMLVDLRDLGIDYDNLNFGSLSEDKRVPVFETPRRFREAVCAGRKC